MKITPIALPSPKRIEYPSRSTPLRRRLERSRALLRLTPTFLMVLILGVAAWGCTHSGKPKPNDSDPTSLRVGLSPGRPPLAFRSDTRLEGIEPDLARRAAQQLGRSVQLIVLKPEQLVPALQRGQIDTIMGHWKINASQADSLLLSQPYLRGGQIVAIRKEDISRFGPPGAMHLPGVRVGYVWESPGEDYASAHLDVEQVEVYGFASPGAALRNLRARRIDFQIGDFPELGWLIERSGRSEIITLETPLTEEDFSWAVSRDNPQLAHALDRVLDQWRANDELRRIIDRWVATPWTTPPLQSGRPGSAISPTNRR